MAPATRADFEIAIICALPLEADPVQDLFDEYYDNDGDPYGKQQGDPNAYTTGRIGQHHIVLAHMPGMGKCSASSVAAALRASFVGIRLALVVGICGAVPFPASGAPIILGDVVISNAVIEFDFGRQYPDMFERKSNLKDTLGRPNHEIRSLLSKLQTHRMRQLLESKICKYLEQLQQRPEINAHYPGVRNDRLFDASYRHMHRSLAPGLSSICIACSSNTDPVCEEALNSDCDSLGCRDILMQRDRLVSDAPVPKPYAHIGTVASASSVMKSGEHRDMLAKREKVIAFEMEGAGVWDNVPCVIIKGACDYSDSHKNKEWQSYAAATAASTAKAFLSFWTPPVTATSNDDKAHGKRALVGGEDSSVVAKRQKTGPSSVQDNSVPVSYGSKQTPPTTRAGLSRLESLWFEQLDARHATIKTAHTQTCKWLLHKEEYRKWRDEAQFSEHHGFLWIKGNPGTGKSTIMKFAFANAQKTLSNTIVLSFFFNARGDNLEKSVEGMYRSLLYQLLKEVTELQMVLPSATGQGNARSWSVESLQSAFQKAIAQLGQRPLICFIDALDECGEGQVRKMVAFFEELGQQAADGQIRLHICFSSRHYPHITIDKGVQITLEVELGHLKDIEKYIASQLKTGSTGRLGEIRAEILEKSAGIFLWVFLVIPLLQEAFEDGHVHALRKRLDEIPKELHKLFEDLLTRDTKNTQIVVLCLQWILFAKRPLKLEELYFAILAGVAPTSLAEWNPEDVTREDMGRFLLSSSKGLAEITKSKKQTVQFIHESVRDFLLEKHGLGVIRANLEHDPLGVSHERLKQCCDAYLKFVASHARVTPDSSRIIAKDDLRIIQKHPFLEYALHSIFNHAEMAASYDISQDTYLADFPLKTWIALDNRLTRYKGHRYTHDASMLYILSQYSVINLVRIELERTQDVNVEGERYSFPIVLASLTGDVRVVELLLSRGANAKAKSKEFQSPLHAALENGHGQVAELLLCHGASIDSDVPRLGALLQTASYRGHEHSVRILLRSDVDVNATYEPYFKSFGTPLGLAASKGHEHIVQMLLNHNAEVNKRDSQNHTALCSASRGGYADIVQMLLDQGADANNICSDHGGLLYVASEVGNKRIVEMCLNRGLEVNATGGRYSSALGAASYRGSLGIVRLLLDRGADVNSSDKVHGNALQVAVLCANPSIAVISLLLANGADINASGGEHGSALQSASGKGDVKLVDFLLANGANINASRGQDGSSLQAASHAGCLDVVRLLLDNGANINASSEAYSGVLQAAASSPFLSIEIIKLLLANGADVNVSREWYGGALQAASSRGHINVVRLLLENGADIDASRGHDGSALQSASRAGHLDTIRLLLENGADVNASRGYDSSALQYAVCAEYPDVVHLLIKNGADVNASSEADGSILQKAALLWSPGIESIRLLLANGANVNASGGKYGSALQAAVSCSRREVVVLLLESGADVNASGGECGSALQIAASAISPNIRTIRLPLEKGADVNASGGEHGSALHAAVSPREPSIEIVRLLLEKGADVNASGVGRGSALHIASHMGHSDIVELLRQYGASE